MYDYIVIGSGIAGLYAALLARDHGRVLLLTKGAIDDTNTKYAQGGIAAAVGRDDSPELHLRDTIVAGAGLVDEVAARVLAEEAPARIADLARFGVPFDTSHGELALGREAAHSRSRIIHAGGDRTGAHIELSLSGLARLSGATVLEHRLVERLLIEDGRITGAATLATEGAPLREEFAGRQVILVTGGAGQLYDITTNPAVATGDGVALAYHAGAELQDMEFIQFHPTALRLPGVPTFLISEAVRGEGAILRAAEGPTGRTAGRAFMAEYHPAAELAPRDIVARAIAAEMGAAGGSHVFLDVTQLDATYIATRFPQIYRYCLDHGLDITQEPIPVAPAAHYIMGGVRTDTWGRTTLPGLYACGEVACTGVHGANRLASNSLLETVVFAKRAVEATLGNAEGDPPALSVGTLDLSPSQSGRGETPTLPLLQSIMWEQVGIERDGSGLMAARERLASLAAALPERGDRAALELANLVWVARLVTEAALQRTESRGAHYRSDHPRTDPAWARRITYRKGDQV